MGRIGPVVIASRCAWTTYNFRSSLIGELQQGGIEVIACGAGGDGFEEKLAAAGICFVPLPLGRGTRDLLQDLCYVFACYRLLRRVRPRLFHAFTVKPVIYGSIAAAMARVPCRVAMITGVGHAFTSSGMAIRVLVSLLYRIALSRVHLVYFQNTHDRDEFLRRKIVSADRCRMIAGSGVDTSRFRPEARQSDRERPVFAMVARALREKGIVEYFAAAARVRVQLPGANFLLVGGPDPRNPTSLTDDQIRDAATVAGVTWVGQVADARSFIQQADIVVLPSYREGTPMSLLEAAAMAKPMIATAVPGCTEIVRDGQTGWLVPPADSEALARAMLRALAERDRWQEYGENARALAISRFDGRIVCRQILDDYRSLISQSAS